MASIQFLQMMLPTIREQVLLISCNYECILSFSLSQHPDSKLNADTQFPFLLCSIKNCIRSLHTLVLGCNTVPSPCPKNIHSWIWSQNLSEILSFKLCIGLSGHLTLPLWGRLPRERFVGVKPILSFWFRHILRYYHPKSFAKERLEISIKEAQSCRVRKWAWFRENALDWGVESESSRDRLVVVLDWIASRKWR